MSQLLEDESRPVWEKVRREKPCHLRSEGFFFPFAIAVISILRSLQTGILSSMENEEILCEAARNGDVDKLKSLIDLGTDFTYFDKDGLTPLMHAAKNGHADVVQLLLDAGAPWNALSPSNLSAGDFAMDAGHQAAFDILLNTGQ